MNFRIEEIKARLAEIEKERGLLLKELDYLSAADSSLPALLGVPSCQKPPVTPGERVALFLRIFSLSRRYLSQAVGKQKKRDSGLLSSLQC